MNFTYCPVCGSPRIAFIDHRYWICDECDFVYYHNVAAAAGVLVHIEGGILLLERSKDPGKGLWDIPGGFVDPGESAEQAAVREVREETGLTITNLRFLESHPNDYRYKKVLYKVCDLFFEAEASGKVIPAEGEVRGWKIVKPDEIDPATIAFPSVRTLLKNRLGIGK